MLDEMDVVDAFGCGSAALDALVAVAERDEARREDAATLPFLQRFVLAVSQESRKESVDGRRYEALKGVGTLAAADEWLGGRRVTRPEEETPQTPQPIASPPRAYAQDDGTAKLARKPTEK